MRSLVLSIAVSLGCLAPVAAQEAGNAELIGELMAFHGSEIIVSAMTTHCYENTGLDNAYKTASENWYLRNIGFLDLADRVMRGFGPIPEGLQEQVENLAGSEIMSAYNQAADKDAFCRAFLEQVDSGALDIDKQLPDSLAKAQRIASE